MVRLGKGILGFPKRASLEGAVARSKSWKFMLPFLPQNAETPCVDRRAPGWVFSCATLTAEKNSAILILQFFFFLACDPPLPRERDAMPEMTSAS